MMTGPRRALAIGCGLLLSAGCAGIIGLEAPKPSADAGAPVDANVADAIADNDAGPPGVSSIAFSSAIDPTWNGGGPIDTTAVVSFDRVPSPGHGFVYTTPLHNGDAGITDAGLSPVLQFLGDDGALLDPLVMTASTQVPQVTQFTAGVLGAFEPSAIGVAGFATAADGGAVKQWATKLAVDDAGVQPGSSNYAIAPSTPDASVFVSPVAISEANDAGSFGVVTLIHPPSGSDSYKAQANGTGTTDLFGAPSGIAPFGNADFVVLGKDATGTRYTLVDVRVAPGGNGISAFSDALSMTTSGVEAFTSAALASSGGGDPILVGTTGDPNPMLQIVDLAKGSVLQLATPPTPVFPVPNNLVVITAATRGSTTVAGGCVEVDEAPIGDAAPVKHGYPFIARINGTTLDPTLAGGIAIATDLANYCVGTMLLDEQNRIVAVLSSLAPDDVLSKQNKIIRFRSTLNRSP